MGRLIESWRARARALKRDIAALALAYRDPRTPWAARALTVCVVAYALSPIDLIPDFIPILGYLDDLVLLPLGIVLAIRLIPPEVLADCRARADLALDSGKPAGRAAALVIVGIWVLGAAALGILIFRRLGH